MVKALTIIEEQVSKKVPHFRGPISQGFEVFLGRYSSNLGCGFGRPQPQNDPAHLFPSSRPNRRIGDPGSQAVSRGHQGR